MSYIQTFYMYLCILYAGLQFIRQLYRGIIPPLATAGVMQSINFSCYEAFRKISIPILKDRYNTQYIDNKNNQNLYLLSIFISGACSGSFISLIATPISLIKVQQQVSTKASVLTCAYNIYNQYGIRRFYRSYCTMFVMESYGRGVYLATYEGTKMVLPGVFNSINRHFSPPTKYTTERSTSSQLDMTPSSSSSSSSSEYTESSLLVRMCSAATAGCTSWTSIYPLDVIKSRMQMDISGSKYTTCIDCMTKTWKEGGMRLMFRGIQYTLIRAAPVAATILPIYEFSKDYLDSVLLT